MARGVVVNCENYGVSVHSDVLLKDIAEIHLAMY